MRNKITTGIFICLTFILIGTSGVYGQKKPNEASELKDKKITIKLTNESLGKIFRELIEKYNIAIGVELSALDVEHNDFDFETNLFYQKESAYEKPVSTNDSQITATVERTWIVKYYRFTVNTENERLEDVMNQIVGQMKNYKWEITDEIVNIFPIKGRDEKLKQLLETNIKQFKSRKNFQVVEIKSLLYALPEFKQFLSEKRFLTGRYSRVSSWDTLFREIEDPLEFSDLTFKELLNRITKIKRGGWILRTYKVIEPSLEKEYIDIDI